LQLRRDEEAGGAPAQLLTVRDLRWLHAESIAAEIDMVSAFRSRLGGVAYLAAITVVLAGIVLEVTQPGGGCNAPRGTPGVICHAPSTPSHVGFLLLALGWISLLLAARAMSDRFRGGPWSALFSVCLGLLIPDALRKLFAARDSA